MLATVVRVFLFQAFLIPDLLNYLLAGEYLTITLVPILSRHIESGGADAASRAFTSVFRFVTLAIGRQRQRSRRASAGSSSMSACLQASPIDIRTS